MKTPNSSNIQEITYNKNKKVLSVTFNPRKTKDNITITGKYDYQEVPEDVFIQLKNAKKNKESIGKLFAVVVKDKGFEFKKTTIKEYQNGKKEIIKDKEKDKNGN